MLQKELASVLDLIDDDLSDIPAPPTLSNGTTTTTTARPHPPAPPSSSLANGTPPPLILTKKKKAKGPGRRGPGTRKKKADSETTTDKTSGPTMAPSEEEEKGIDIDVLLASYRSATDGLPNGITEEPMPAAAGGASRHFVVKSLTPLCNNLEPDLIVFRTNMIQLMDDTSAVLGRNDTIHAAKANRVIQDLAVLQARLMDQYAKLLRQYETFHRDMVNNIMDAERRAALTSQKMFEVMGAAAFSPLYSKPSG